MGVDRRHNRITLGLRWIAIVLVCCLFYLIISPPVVKELKKEDKNITTPKIEKDPNFDWSDVDFITTLPVTPTDFSYPHVSLVNEFTQSLVEYYNTTPKFFTPHYAIVSDCSLNPDGYFIKNRKHYPLYNRNLDPHDVILEPYKDEEVDSYQNAIAMFFPSSISKEKIITLYAPTLLCLPNDVIFSSKLVVNRDIPGLRDVLRNIGFPDENFHVKTANWVKAETMYVIEYPPQDCVMPSAWNKLANLMKKSFTSSSFLDSIVIINEHDPRMGKFDKTVQVLKEKRKQVQYETIPANEFERMSFFYSAKYIISFGTVSLPYAIFMKPNSLIISVQGEFDKVEGVLMAASVGIRSYAVAIHMDFDIRDDVVDQIFDIIKSEVPKDEWSSE